MDFTTILKPGMTGGKEERVTERNTALAMGSGGLSVYATPSMVALMEGAAVNALAASMPADFSTVGTEITIKHLSASPLAMTIRAKAELVTIDGRHLVFKVEAFDDAGKIGEGDHCRFIIENEKFVLKVQEKLRS